MKKKWKKKERKIEYNLNQRELFESINSDFVEYVHKILISTIYTIIPLYENGKTYVAK